MAFWAVSNCETVIYREKYVKKLQEYMEVNVFTRVGQSLDFHNLNQIYILGWAQWNLSRFEFKFDDTSLSS